MGMNLSGLANCPHPAPRNCDRSPLGPERSTSAPLAPEEPGRSRQAGAETVCFLRFLRRDPSLGMIRLIQPFLITMFRHTACEAFRYSTYALGGVGSMHFHGPTQVRVAYTPHMSQPGPNQRSPLTAAKSREVSTTPLQKKKLTLSARACAN